MNEDRWKSLVEYTKEDEEVLKELFEKEKKELQKTFDVEGEELDEFAMNRVYVMYKKKRMSTGDTYEGTIFNFGDKTDFGALNKYNEIKQKFDNGDDAIKRELYSNGMIDEEGNPLWNPSNTNATFKYQDKSGDMLPKDKRRIIPKNEMRRVGIGLMKKEEDKDFKPTMITLFGDEDTEIPLKQKCKFKMTGRYDENLGVYRLNSSADKFSYEKLSDEVLKYKELSKILENYFSDYIFKFNKNIKTWVDENSSLPFSVVKCMCLRIIPNVSTKSNLMVVGSASYTDEGNQLSCFVPDTMTLPGEGEVGAYVIGSLNVKDDNVSMNVMDCISLDKTKHEEIKPEEQKEKPKEKPSWLKGE